MADFRTSGCERFDQKEIVLHLSDEAGMSPTWLLDYFTTEVASGRRFKAGETVQIGWMITMLKENREGDLEVWEPRFGPVPIQWMRGINKTIRHVILQNSVCEMVHQEPVYASLQHAGNVAFSFWRVKDAFFMSRVEPVGRASGWQFSSERRDEYFEKLHSLFEVASRVPLIIPFLALPPGATVERNREEIRIEFRGLQVSSGDHDLLRRLHEGGMAEA